MEIIALISRELQLLQIMNPQKCADMLQAYIMDFKAIFRLRRHVRFVRSKLFCDKFRSNFVNKNSIFRIGLLL